MAKTKTKPASKDKTKTRATPRPVDPETDPRQSAEAREVHNGEHVGSAEWAEKCYFCEQQQAGAQGPVPVPENPPVLQ